MKATKCVGNPRSLPPAAGSSQNCPRLRHCSARARPRPPGCDSFAGPGRFRGDVSDRRDRPEQVKSDAVALRLGGPDPAVNQDRLIGDVGVADDRRDEVGDLAGLAEPAHWDPSGEFAA